MNPAKKWLKISVTCPEKLIEAVSDLLGVLSGVGVEIRPLSDRGDAVVTGFFAVENGGGEKVLHDKAAELTRLASAELASLFTTYHLNMPEPSTEIIDDQDWATSWQQFFRPFEIIPGLVIKPSWAEYTPRQGQRIITMDPGMAFGTGQHASTRLALSLLAPCFNSPGQSRPEKILDVGTGTGILAMAGALFGADQVMAIDNDPEAVRVATDNVLANKLDWTVGISGKPLAELQGSFDLICANIVHDVLVDMVPDIRRLLNSSGRLILSGILRGRQEKNLEQVYCSNNMRLVCTLHEEEWAAMFLASAE